MYFARMLQSELLFIANSCACPPTRVELAEYLPLTLLHRFQRTAQKAIVSLSRRAIRQTIHSCCGFESKVEQHENYLRCCIHVRTVIEQRGQCFHRFTSWMWPYIMDYSTPTLMYTQTHPLFHVSRMNGTHLSLGVHIGPSSTQVCHDWLSTIETRPRKCSISTQTLSV